MRPWSRGRDLESSAPIVALSIAFAVACLAIPGAADFMLDDAWIHLAYAKSLRLGDGMSYNPGDWETGFSSPLWVWMLALWPTGTDPVLAVKLLGALLHGLTAWLATVLAVQLARKRASHEQPVPVLAIGLFAGVLVASTPVLVQAATSGMEVPLASALLLATTLAAVAGRVGVAATLGGMSTFARPEAVLYTCVLAIVLGWARRRGTNPSASRAPIAAAAGSMLALAAWSSYCLVVSGQPWPNTQYVKGRGGGLPGLRYLAEEVLPWQPWLVSLVGVIAIALVVRNDVKTRTAEASAILLGTFATMVTIALSRPLHVGIQFYESRYFTIVAALPVTVLALAVIGRKTWQGGALLIPVAILNGLQAAELVARGHDLADDTALLHRAPAIHIAQHLPTNAVVAVEGAGAARYFAPRTMTIVDLVGLNDRIAARLHADRTAKLCHFVDRAPTHVLIPADWEQQLDTAFDLKLLQAFHDPRYTQVEPARSLDVHLYAVKSVKSRWRERCGN